MHFAWTFQVFSSFFIKLSKTLLNIIKLKKQPNDQMKPIKLSTLEWTSSSSNKVQQSSSKFTQFNSNFEKIH